MTLDFLTPLFRLYFDLLGGGHPGAVLLNLMVIFMIACLFLPGMLGAARRVRERKIGQQSRTLIRRIRLLIPIYRETVNEFLDMIERRDERLAKIAAQIPPEMKVKAERDFCLGDSGRTDAIALLQMERARLLNKSTS